MKGQIRHIVQREIKTLFELKQTERLWHIPVLASLCVGVPLLVGLYFNSLHYAMLSCTGGLVILYLPLAPVAQRMIMLVACSFGFMVSLAVGISFSFHYMVSSVVLALFATGVHWVSRYFNMKPPGRSERPGS